MEEERNLKSKRERRNGGRREDREGRGEEGMKGGYDGWKRKVREKEVEKRGRKEIMGSLNGG